MILEILHIIEFFRSIKHVSNIKEEIKRYHVLFTSFICFVHSNNSKKLSRKWYLICSLCVSDLLIAESFTLKDGGIWEKVERIPDPRMERVCSSNLNCKCSSLYAKAYSLISVLLSDTILTIS